MTKPVIVTRAGKGSGLSFVEGDANFTNLQNATVLIAADTGITQAIDLNSTITVTGGTGLSSAMTTNIVTLSLDNTAVTPASYTNSSITIDAQGRITSASNGTAPVTSITQGTGITITGTTTPTVNLASGVVTAGSATYASITVDTYGRVTAISSGTAPLVSGGALGTPLSGTVTNLTGTASININGTVGATTATTGRFTTVQSTIAIGTPPFSVTSTTVVTNLNASFLGGQTFAGPGPIGSTTASTGAFTTLSATGTTTLATSLTGVLKTASGVVSAATAGTDYVAPSGALGTPSSGTLTNCTTDGTNAVGYRNLPAVGSKVTAYTLAVADKGKYVQVGSGGSIVIPNAIFAEGDCIVIVNNHTAAITITCTITTAYIGGTNTTKATVSLATRGLCNIFFLSSTICIITGNVS